MGDHHPDSKLKPILVWLQIEPSGRLLAIGGEYELVLPSGGSVRKQAAWVDPPMDAVTGYQHLVDGFITYLYESEELNRE